MNAVLPPPLGPTSRNVGSPVALAAFLYKMEWITIGKRSATASVTRMVDTLGDRARVSQPSASCQAMVSVPGHWICGYGYGYGFGFGCECGCVCGCERVCGLGCPSVRAVRASSAQHGGNPGARAGPQGARSSATQFVSLRTGRRCAQLWR